MGRLSNGSRVGLSLPGGGLHVSWNTFYSKMTSASEDTIVRFTY